MAKLRAAKKRVPARKVPVKSTRKPMIMGPVNPPISAMQKKSPPADPMNLGSTSGVSIKRRVRIGKKPDPIIPYRISPMIRRVPDVVTIISNVGIVNKADKATKRWRKNGGIIRGKERRAGIPETIGIDAVKPADTGDSPFASKIFGSQLLNP